MFPLSPARRTGIWSVGGPGHPLCHSASIAVCSFCSWTMLGSVAHSGALDWMNKLHPAAMFVMIMACDVAIIGPLCIAIDEEHMDGSDSSAFFASALVGCSLSTACCFMIPGFRNELCRHIWTLSGVYVGVAVELTMRPFTRLYQHILSNSRGPYSDYDPHMPLPHDEGRNDFFIYEDPDEFVVYENPDEFVANENRNESDKENDERAAQVARLPRARRLTPYIAVILLSAIFGAGSVSLGYVLP